MKFDNRKQKLILLIALQLTLFTGAIFIANQYLQKNPHTEFTRADNAEKQITVALYPPINPVSSGTKFSVTPFLTATSSKSVGFVKLTINFNPKYIKLINIDLKMINSNLKPLIVEPKSPLFTTESGTILLTLGGKDIKNIPSGSIQLPTMTFMTIMEGTNTIDVDKSKSQIIFENLDEAELLITPAIISPISPTLAPTPEISVSPVISPSPSPTTEQMAVPTTQTVANPTNNPTENISSPTISPSQP
jgi:hypothetical protein